MKSKAPIQFSLPAALILALGLLVVPFGARAQVVSKTAHTGSYMVNLKVLPAESFSGPHAAMARDGGAQPNQAGGPEHPNHHMVVFVRKGGKPVENATVTMRYRQVSPTMGNWKTLPVVRMHVRGHGLATTHYGNNVALAPGSYEVRVSVNGSKPAILRFSLAG